MRSNIDKERENKNKTYIAYVPYITYSYHACQCSSDVPHLLTYIYIANGTDWMNPGNPRNNSANSPNDRNESQSNVVTQSRLPTKAKSIKTTAKATSLDGLNPLDFVSLTMDDVVEEEDEYLDDTTNVQSPPV